MRTSALSILLVLLCGQTAHAEPEITSSPLGGLHVYVEFDAMWVQHRTFETDDAGPFAGLGAYGHLGRGWYLGAEMGKGAAISVFGIDESSCTSYELNAKRGFAFTPDWAAALGGGVSYCRSRYEDHSFWDPADTREIDEDSFGSQVFGEFMLTGSRFFLGLKVEYQLTADFDTIAEEVSPGDGWDYSNLRIGVQLGGFGWR